LTTTVRITNEGPERALVSYYDENRQFQERREILKKGDSIVVNVWDGCIPVVQAIHLADQVIENGAAFFSVPPIGGG
jgi:hypothetical protein